MLGRRLPAVPSMRALHEHEGSGHGGPGTGVRAMGRMPGTSEGKSRANVKGES